MEFFRCYCVTVTWYQFYHLSLSLVVIIVTEMFIGTPIGLGRKIIDSQLTYEIKTMYAVILLTGILGYLLNSIFLFIETRFLHWSGR